MKLVTFSLNIMLFVFIPAKGKILATESESIDANKAILIANNDHPTIAYAAKELVYFLEETSGIEFHQNEAKIVGNYWKFQLAVDSVLPAGEFKVTCSQPANQQFVVNLVGHDPTGVLHAVYTLLEKLGICFDITGPIFPDNINLHDLDGWSTYVKPQVKLRGIRQHLNFPMDISSYPLAEAKEYIRNLARLRMNLIVLHSYDQQFFAYPELNMLAGNFFYGQRHNLPEIPFIKNNIRNRHIFCIPEIEAIIDRPKEKSDAAIYWLSEVMRQAEICGLTIQFSFSPSGGMLSPEVGLNVCKTILSAYPQIDILEMLTNENAGNPDKILSKYIDIAKLLKETLGTDCPRLVLGVYETGPALKDGLNYLRQYCPSYIQWSFLPAHGAHAVVDAIQDAHFIKEDWKRSIIYTWIEFDGLMYLQQNSVLATQQLLHLAKKSLQDDPVPSIAFNHWRTAENRTALRYAARACLEADFTPEMFYAEYSHALGLADVKLYTEAMKELDDVDVFCRDNLFNIGFSYVGCWIAPAGISWTRSWKENDVQEAVQRFSEIQQKLAGSINTASTREGRQYLRFLENRLRTTIIHLQAINLLLDLHDVCDDAHPELLGINDQKMVQEHCNAAMELTEQYMKLHAEAIEDRGCEGTLISYYHTIPAYINHIQDIFLGDTLKINQPEYPSGPPAPGKPSKY